MVSIMLIRNTDGGLEYLHRAILYVGNDERSLYTGGYGVCPYDVEDAYLQMLAVKQYFGKTSGNPLVHIIVSFDDCVRMPWEAVDFGRRIAGFYGASYQTLWCVHFKPHSVSNYHVHILLNSVSFLDGRMFHCGIPDMQIFQRFVQDVTGRKTTFRFENKKR